MITFLKTPSQYLIFAICLLIAKESNAQLNFQHTSTLGTTTARINAFADIDNDNDVDVLVGNKLYINDSLGNFTFLPSSLPNILYQFGKFADIDNDNDQDLLIMGRTSFFTALYNNDGSGNFILNTSSFENIKNGDGFFVDIDNDSDLDIIISGFNGTQTVTKVYLNNGLGNYSLTSSSIIGLDFNTLGVSDIDNDGDMDLLMTGRTPSLSSQTVTKVYLNDGTGNYTLTSGTGLIDVYAGSMSFSDVDEDGDEDIFLSGNSNSGYISTLYLNDGTGSFSPSSSNFTAVKNSSSPFFDIDNDGDDDLLVSGWTGSGQVTRLYLNDGNGAFIFLSTPYFYNTSQKQISYADINSNGKQDVLIGKWLFENISCLSDTFLNIVAFESYTVPSGDETYYIVGDYIVMDTVQNFCGGDSLITINLHLEEINQIVCAGDTTLISTSLINDTLYNFTGFNTIDTAFIPDDSDGISGNGVTNPASININVNGIPSFDDTINSIYDISNICIDFEHSYAGDLNIKLIAPNGSFVYLVQMNPPSPPNSNFGVPNLSFGYGTPLTYCWSPSATTPPITSSSSYGVQIPTDTFQAVGSWNSLIGSPKNGNWQIQIFDDYSGDNGYVFQASISFDSLFFIVDNVEWESHSNIISTTLDTNEILFYSQINGIYNLKYYFISTNGDSVSFIKNIKVISPSLVYDTFNLCFGDTFILQNNDTILSSGTFLDTLNCNSVVSNTLFFSPFVVYNQIDTFLCDGDVYYFNNGNSTDTSIIYNDTIKNVNGCDSVINQTHITALESFFQVVNICEGDSFSLFGITHYATSSLLLYTDTLSSLLSCDSIRYTLMIIQKPSYSDTLNYEFCLGDSFTVNNTLILNTGQYIDSFQSIYGCDSLFVYNIVFNPPVYSDTMQYDLCQNNTISINGISYTSPGLYQQSLVSNCDSIFIFEINMILPSDSVFIKNACDSYTWIDGNTYTTNNNIATYTLVNSVGCDSTITLNLSILNSSTFIDTQTACDSYTWIDGYTYTTNNNIATYTLLNSIGCDSIITLGLTILNNSIHTDTIHALDPYTWIDGNIYTVNNNIAIFTVVNSVGCDSIITLNLTIDTIIQGTITTSTTTPLQNSKVYLIEYFSAQDSVFAQDSTTTDASGFYQFTNVFQNAYVKAVPNLSIYPNEIPTYNVSSAVFQNADAVTLNSSTTIVDFSTIAGINPGGNGFLGGVVSIGAGKKAGIGDPIPNLSLVLMNSNNQVVKQTTTNANGEFSFDNLEETSFSIWVDKAGVLNNLAPNISLVDDNNQDDLQLVLHKTSLENITNVGIETFAESNFAIYPNPTNGKLVLINKENQEDYNIEILNLLGETIYKNKFNSTKTILDLNKIGLSKGTYFIKLSTEKVNLISKVIYQ